ncbi:MAG: hypothetical protein IPG50_27730 [Myxococcales bacterium]|nr:hypothetical protein [Myxococcales bacterium]
MRSRPAKTPAAKRRSPSTAGRDLARLRKIAGEFEPGAAATKRALVDKLSRARLATADAVARLHDVLCFLRAYPDDAELLACVEAALAAFADRPDLVRFRSQLDDSGIAGTDIYYTFFAATARWLAQRFPERLTVAWDYLADDARLGERLNLLATYPENLGLEDYDLGVRGWLERMKRPTETDAAYLLERWWREPMSETTRQQLYEEMQLLLKLAWGPGGPARTREKLDGLNFPRSFQETPLDHRRPDLWKAIATPPTRVRTVSEAEGERLVTLAREAMISRSRDLDAFCYGDPRDVRIIEFDQGLCFVAIGMKPERRLLLESVYGFLTIKNGVPIGYVLAAAFNESAEMAYNVFDTWRGYEAANIYGRALSATSHLLGAKAFSAPPYQLGHDNAEGLASGAWWFYQKLGFKPRDPAIVRMMDRELAKMQRRRGYRSSVATLQELSSVDMFLERGTPEPDIVGVFPLGAVGLAITDSLACRFGADRERGLDVSEEEAARALAVRGLNRWTPDERLAFRRWAPLVGILPGISRWTADDRKALVDVIRAKGARYESDYVRAYNAHAKLRRALSRLVQPHSKLV